MTFLREVIQNLIKILLDIIKNYKISIILVIYIVIITN